MSEDDVRELVRHRAKFFARNKGSTGFTAWCCEAGVNKTHASTFMNGKGSAPTDLLDALGLEYAIVQKKSASNGATHDH